MSLSQPHYKKSTYYNKWFDYTLRMLHVTEKDNGAYDLKLISPQGAKDRKKNIILTVITEYKKGKWQKWAKQAGKNE